MTLNKQTNDVRIFNQLYFISLLINYFINFITCKFNFNIKFRNCLTQGEVLTESINNKIHYTVS